MANINDAFPSKYLKASDLDGENVTVTITHVAFEEVGKDKEMRPILFYEGSEKGIVLNKTNATNISKLYGSETDDWGGKKRHARNGLGGLPGPVRRGDPRLSSQAPAGTAAAAGQHADERQ
jgi:hypothetical protein